MRRAVALGALVVALGVPAAAHAFCGFYVSGAGADLFNNATQVVMMRHGSRTVLSMQNNYQGPPEDFAMVVPVPVVLQKDNVKTLPGEIFARVDKLAAPRLVEYWEQDPCAPMVETKKSGMVRYAMANADKESDDGSGVTIEAQFKVGEYDIVILSAKDSTGLDSWLKKQKYKIPDGAEPFLKPYVEAGSKFFVAKVDTKKVKFENGMAMLSPLRFHYDSEEFALPVRLGLMNSAGKQDLIVSILAQGQRYEVANYGNVTIPTNLELRDEAKQRFGEFYAALFDATLEKNPGSVVTEYAWDSSTCDPCPEPALTQSELATLGADVLPGGAESYYSMVLTRLHARYDKASLKDDLVFKAAPPIAGGREWLADDGKLEEGARPDGSNNFQGRYAIRHEWTGKIECENPMRGQWGGPPGGGEPQPTAATKLAFAPRGKIELPKMVAKDVPELALAAAPAAGDSAAKKPPATDKPAKADDTPAKTEKKKGCGCQASGRDSAGGLILLLAVVALARRRRAC